MIRPPGMGGVVFSEAGEGDIRGDLLARSRLCASAGIPTDWATVNQVHGDRVVRANSPGEQGDADAVWTTVPGLAIAVFTADCFGVVLTSPAAVGVAHAGWRGARDGVVGALRHAMASGGHPPGAAAVGPGIGPCCFEVGEEVAAEFPGRVSRTRWDTPSVDLPAVVAAQLEGLEVFVSGLCTHHDPGLFSHRAGGDAERLAAVGWLR